MTNNTLTHEDIMQLLIEAGCPDEFTRQFLATMNAEAQTEEGLSMKRISSLLLIGVLFFMLTACGASGGGVETVPSTEPRPSQQTATPAPAEPDTSGGAETVDPAASPAGIPITRLL